jgi:hypothetical protein
MKSQIFKSIVPITILFELLEKICVKDEKCYNISKSVFKSAEYHNIISSFCDKILEHYHISKRHYVDRKMTYNKFITVVRQICSVNNVSYTSKIIYNKSDYEILYYISKRAEMSKTDAEMSKTDTEMSKTDTEMSKTDTEMSKTDTEEIKLHASLYK